MLEDHVNAVLSAPIEDQPAQYMGAHAPVMTAATVYTAGQYVVVACPTMNVVTSHSVTQVCIAG